MEVGGRECERGGGGEVEELGERTREGTLLRGLCLVGTWEREESQFVKEFLLKVRVVCFRIEPGLDIRIIEPVFRGGGVVFAAGFVLCALPAGFGPLTTERLWGEDFILLVVLTERAREGGVFGKGIGEMGVGVEVEPIIAVKDSVVGAVSSRVSHSSEHRS